MSLVVSDTGPFHYLILIGDVDVLPKLFSKVYIPSKVYFELMHEKTLREVRIWAESPRNGSLQ